MKKGMVLLLSALLSVAASSAMADDISIGVPSYGGNGCPAGTASVALGTDNKSLSILFDQFSAEAGGNTGRRIDRKSCNVAIPVHVPQGYSVSIFQIDYRGFTAVPRGGRAQFQAEYFFAGGRGPVFQQQFSGPRSEDYTLNNTLAAEAVVWSACGQDVILRTNASMMAQSNQWNEQTLATVDSMDLRSGIIYQLQWKRCW